MQPDGNIRDGNIQPSTDTNSDANQNDLVVLVMWRLNSPDQTQHGELFDKKHDGQEQLPTHVLGERISNSNPYRSVEIFVVPEKMKKLKIRNVIRIIDQ